MDQFMRKRTMNESQKIHSEKMIQVNQFNPFEWRHHLLQCQLLIKQISPKKLIIYDSALSPPPTSLFLVVSTIPYWLNNIPQHFSDLSCFPLA